MEPTRLVVWVACLPDRRAHLLVSAAPDTERVALCGQTPPGAAAWVYLDLIRLGTCCPACVAGLTLLLRRPAPTGGLT